MDFEDIIIAQATPPGKGAISIVRMSGAGCIEVLNNFFSKDLEEVKGNEAVFGNFKEAKTGKVIDECVLTIYRAPRSYTKQDSVEISCHGSPFVVNKIIQSLLGSNVRMANPGEFTQRAYLNGQMDLVQAEAVADLINSESDMGHETALSHLKGEFSKKMKNLRSKLVRLGSLLELELDFSEEDVEFADRKELKQNLQEVEAMLISLLESYKTGNAIKNGIRTVIAGLPNAGKSTLLNAMLGDDRAIVSDQAGTTRDVLEESIYLNGIKFILTDTAGLRDSNDTIESEGIRRALNKVSAADIVLYVLDVTRPDLDVRAIQDEISKLNSEGKVLLIFNKMDLHPTFNGDHLLENSSSHSYISCSAINKMNVPYIQEKLVELSLGEIKDGTVVTSQRQYEALLKALDAIQATVHDLDLGQTEDLIATNLKRGLHHVGLITGEIHTDELLEKIFSEFCIGK